MCGGFLCWAAELGEETVSLDFEENKPDVEPENSPDRDPIIPRPRDHIVMDLHRMLFLYEMYKRILNVKGSIIEVGVGGGVSFQAWYRLHAMLDPGVVRHMYGFDTFGGGFPSVHEKDHNEVMAPIPGDVNFGDTRQQIVDGIIQQSKYCMPIFEAAKDGSVMELVQGNAVDTIPMTMQKHPELIVALLWLDVDLYEPTKAALEHIVPRMPKGAVIGFDELDIRRYPGETLALDEVLGIRNCRIESFPWAAYWSFLVLE